MSEKILQKKSYTNLEELESDSKKPNWANFFNWERIKKHSTNVVIGLIYILACYIVYYLYLTISTREEGSIILNRMQDIIIKTSGWILFVISFLRNNAKKNNEE